MVFWTSLIGFKLIFDSFIMIDLVLYAFTNMYIRSKDKIKKYIFSYLFNNFEKKNGHGFGALRLQKAKKKNLCIKLY